MQWVVRTPSSVLTLGHESYHQISLAKKRNSLKNSKILLTRFRVKVFAAFLINFFHRKGHLTGSRNV